MKKIQVATELVRIAKSMIADKRDQLQENEDKKQQLHDNLLKELKRLNIDGCEFYFTYNRDKLELNYDVQLKYKRVRENRKTQFYKMIDFINDFVKQIEKNYEKAEDLVQKYQKQYDQLLQEEKQILKKY